MKKMGLGQIISLSLLIVFISSQALASHLRIAVSGGVGSFSADRNGVSRTEGPFCGGVGIDYDVNSRLALGAENFRSAQLSPLGTSIGMTGFTARWYAWGPVPNALNFDASFLRARILQKGMFPYIGSTIGFAQASVPEDATHQAVLALDILGGAKAGFDYPIGDQFAVRTELNMGFPLMGTGKISYMDLAFGILLFW
jgi:hypothetical protein